MMNDSDKHQARKRSVWSVRFLPMIRFVYQYSGSFGLIVLLLLLAALGATVAAQVNLSSTAESPPTPPPQPYDGLELGVAFEIPGEWAKASYEIEIFEEGHSQLQLGTQPLVLGRSFPPSQAEPGDSFGQIVVENIGAAGDRSRAERLNGFADQGICPAEGNHFAESEIIYRECLYPFDLAGLQGSVIEATFFRGERLIYVMGMGVSNPTGRMPDIATTVAGIIGSMQPLTFSGWTVRAHPAYDHVMSYPDAYRLHDTGFSYELYDTGLDRWLEWRVIYDDPTYYGVDSVDAALANAAQIGDGSFGIVLEPPSPFVSQPDRQRALFGREGEMDEVVLLTAAIPNPDMESPMPIILFHMAVPITHLDSVQPAFEQVVRGFRGKSVPLFASPP